MYFKILIAVFFMLIAGYASAAITVSVDRNPVVVDESFQLIFKSDEQIRGQPDFSPLKQDLTILNSSSRSNTQIVNGKVSYTQQWVLTVLANRTGSVRIPPLKFGKQSSPARSIVVVSNINAKRNAISDDVFIEVNVDKDNPYVQAQVVFTVKLFRAIATNNATLSEPVVKGGQAVIEKLGDDNSYEAQRGGKRYVVIVRRYAIFPQKSGSMTIEPVVFQGQVGTGSFFGFDPFGPAANRIVKRSEQIDLTVKPIPDAFTGDYWLPASNLKIQEQWSVAPDKLKQGEAVTRTLILEADGLASSQLPMPDDQVPAGFKQYPDQPQFEQMTSDTGFTSIRREKMAIIPTTSGKQVMPAIKLAWWNTKTDTIEYAELPERQIVVAAAAGQSLAQNKNAGLVAQAEQDGLQESGAGVLNAPSQQVSTVWQWVSLIFFCLWLLTLYGWFKSRHAGQRATVAGPEARLSKYKTEIIKACKNNDPVAAKKSLLAWANRYWPQQHINNFHQLKDMVNDDFKQELDKLNACLYAKQKQEWDGQAFIRSFHSQSFAQQSDKQTTGNLQPLYKS